MVESIVQKFVEIINSGLWGDGYIPTRGDLGPSLVFYIIFTE